LRIVPVRRGEEGELLLEILGMFGRGDGHRDLFSISENGDRYIFVGGQKK
jgi:hypothetical protein